MYLFKFFFKFFWFLILSQQTPGIELQSKDIERRHYIDSPIGRWVNKFSHFYENILLECLVAREYHGTGLLNKAIYELSRLCFFNFCSFLTLLKYKEGHSKVLRRLVTKRVKCAHKSKNRLDFSLCNHPVFSEKEQRKHTRNAFTTSTNC